MTKFVVTKKWNVTDVMVGFIKNLPENQTVTYGELAKEFNSRPLAIKSVIRALENDFQYQHLCLKVCLHNGTIHRIKPKLSIVKELNSDPIIPWEFYWKEISKCI